MRIQYLLYFLKANKQSERKLLIDAIENATHISWPILPEVHQKSAVILIQELKKHDFYESLNLFERFILLKMIINNIFCREVLGYAIEHLPDSEFAEEKKILRRRVDTLKIVHLLEKIEEEILDLVELAPAFHETESLITTHLEEMTKLKKIISLNIITFNHIKWFFHSELFDLILDVAEDASFLPSIYKFMLGEKLITQQAELNQHIELLLNKKVKEKQAFNYESFRQILYSKTNIPRPVSTRFTIAADGILLHNKRKNIPSPLITESADLPESKKLRTN